MIFGIEPWIFILLIVCLGLVAAFEFVNWFNDTANAIAPVIYTRSLKPKRAVVLAWILNFLWVIFWWIWVAMAIMHLLPLAVIAEQPVSFWIALVSSLLISAIIWNLTTWYLAIPSSSSHALIWSIIWVSVAMMYLPISWWELVSPNWGKAKEVLESLLFSPLIWFSIALILMFVSYKIIHSKRYFKNPKPDKKIKKPGARLRSLLIWTSAWVSFAHGSNDWQKWVWIAMLILISLLPSMFALNPKVDIESIKQDINYISWVVNDIDSNVGDESQKKMLKDVKENIIIFNNLVEWNNRMKLRVHLLKIQKDLSYVNTTSFSFVNKVNADSVISKLQSSEFKSHISSLTNAIDYAPIWIIALISISIWLWTMVWRKRIVTTIWEWIWNTKMNYAQATNSALITAVTISTASKLWLPVSTTHVLSSSVAWSMVWAKKWWVQWDTVKHIIMAWVLTLPTTILLSGFLFSIIFYTFLK